MGEVLFKLRREERMICLNYIKEEFSVRLTYKVQRNYSVLIVILSNILTDIFGYWLYRSIGWGIIGLMFIINPVVPDNMEGNKKAVF